MDDVSGAAALAAACGTSVEVLGRRSETTQVFVDASGVGTLVSSVVPQRVRRGDGSWADVDTTLHADGAEFVPTASSVDVRFSGGGSGPLVTWHEGNATLTLSWPGVLPAPRVSGDTAVYDNVLPDVNLHVTAGVEGFSHVLEVLTPQAAADPALAQIRYLLGGDMRVEAQADGGLELFDSAGTAVGEASTPLMWDSAVADTTAAMAMFGEPASTPGVESDVTGPGDDAAVAQMGVQVASGELTLTPDAAMLASPAERFPLFIDPAFNKLRTKWAYANSNNTDWDTGNRALVGRNPTSGQLFRSYFSFDISAMRNTTVLSASITARLDHSWSCSPTWVHLYKTNGSWAAASGQRIGWGNEPLGSTATWIGSWEGNANEAGGCGVIQPDVDAVFDDTALKTSLQARVASSDSYWVGLCACNSSDQYESSQDRWKKFYTDKTYLVATYDLKPNAPTALSLSTTTDCSSACLSPAVVRTTTPTLRVNVSDPFTDTLSTVFEVRTAASDTATLKAGNAAAPVVTAVSAGVAKEASWKVPSTALTGATTYYWRARSKDEAGLTGAWSSWQQLTVDTAKPAVNPVNSTEYPFKQWGAVVGTAGTFTTTASDDVKSFEYAFDNSPVTSVPVAAAPATLSVSKTPDKDMVHTMSVKAIDTAGNVSDTVVHQFWVTPAANRCWTWKLDETSGTTAADTGNTDSTDPVCPLLAAPNTSSASPMPGTLSGGVSFGVGHIGNGAVFTGTGQVATSGPVLDTTKDFTVMAWVQPTDLTAGDQTILSQDGANGSRFQLHFDAQANAGAGGWCFSMRSADDTSAPTPACATGEVMAATWVHIAGSYSATAGEIAVYVLGDPELCGGEKQTATATGSWAAGGSFVIGRAKGSSAEFLHGVVDHVYAHQKVLAATDICIQAGM